MLQMKLSDFPPRRFERRLSDIQVIASAEGEAGGGYGEFDNLAAIHTPISSACRRCRNLRIFLHESSL